jgi:deoxyribonuclease V
VIAAFDVNYLPDGRAIAAAVLFADYRDAEPVADYRCAIAKTAAYHPGSFYLRELPCILDLAGQIRETPDEMVVDGYVSLGSRPGLGQHLYQALDAAIPVIGVAKSSFRTAPAQRIFRGASQRPLYVTCAGIELQTACERIRTMHGDHRIPTLLKRVDRLARGNLGRWR